MPAFKTEHLQQSSDQMPTTVTVPIVHQPTSVAASTSSSSSFMTKIHALKNNLKSKLIKSTTTKPVEHAKREPLQPQVATLSCAHPTKSIARSNSAFSMGFGTAATTHAQHQQHQHQPVNDHLVTKKAPLRKYDSSSACGNENVFARLTKQTSTASVGGGGCFSGKLRPGQMSAASSKENLPYRSNDDLSRRGSATSGVEEVASAGGLTRKPTFKITKIKYDDRHLFDTVTPLPFQHRQPNPKQQQPFQSNNMSH